MLYTIRKLPVAPIYIVRVKPPMNAAKSIYAIDMALLRLTGGLQTPFYRIDDLTALQPYHFTLSDARDWFSGPVREDAHWRGHCTHVVVAEKHIARLAYRLQDENNDIYVHLVPTYAAAFDHIRVKISHRRDD